MFWDKFLYLCNKANVAPSALCKNLGFTSATCTGWKNGAKPRQSAIFKICEYFGVEPSYFDEDFVIPQKQSTKVPILGTIAAGIPIEAIQDIIDYEEISPDMLKGGAEYFGLKIQGGSMEPRMYTGDVVLFRKQDDVESGEIAAVLIDGEQATVKKIEKDEDGISLVPLNPMYDVRRFTNEQIKALPITILGKAVEVRAKL